MWILGLYWRKAYDYLIKKLPHVPVDDLATIADMFYAAGPGRIRPKLDKLPRADFEHFKNKYPSHKATIHASNIWGLTSENNPAWNLPLIDAFVSGDDGGIIPKPAKEGFLLAVLLVAVVWFFFQSQKKEASK